jgi:hypothetical protein
MSFSVKHYQFVLNGGTTQVFEKSQHSFAYSTNDTGRTQTTSKHRRKVWTEVIPARLF